ncbi:hypothetical protein PG984_009813 [Apiospora sp. TS-2023a]
MKRIATWDPEDKITFFLERLYSSDYSGGALPLVELCLTFKLWEHPEKEVLIRHLKAIGNCQRSFQTENDINLSTIEEAARLVAELLKLRPLPQEILDDLEAGMERLSMSNNVTPNQPQEEEVAI